ncbi:MAG: SAM-dependent methyltransferase, partial [Pseudomonadota bacterium]
AAAREAIIARLDSQALVLISDAGSPLINDPGFKLARDAIAAGKSLTALPGASAPILALSLSGLPTDRFSFYGYLPNKQIARQAVCDDLARVKHTQIVFESVHRIQASLLDLAAAMPERPAAVCREMTKTYEEIDRGSLTDLAMRWRNRPAKGEFVIVIGPAPADVAAGDITGALKAAFAEGMSVKQAAAAIAQDTGSPKRQVYQAALAMKQAGADD